MSLARLLLRADRRLAAGALGIGAAILLPVAASLVLEGLRPHVDPGQPWLAYAPGGAALDLSRLPPPRLALAEQVVDGARFCAYAVGGPAIAPGEVVPMPTAGPPPARLGDRSLVASPPASHPLLPPDCFLVDRSLLATAPVTLALLDGPAQAPGVTIVPARGADAFEQRTLRDLAANTGALLVASVPGVALVAAAFAAQEVRELRGQVATLVALGGARLARQVVLGRVLLVASLGLGVAGTASVALWAMGGVFHPPEIPWAQIGLALAASFAAACGAGALGARRGLAGVGRILRERGPGGGEVRLPAPAPLRPLLVGASILPVLAVAALLFSFDVGFPVAAAQIPGDLVAGSGEFVLGAQDGLHVGHGVPDAVAGVAALDPAVAAIVAETPVPTLVDGQAVVLRGGAWPALASYHGLALVAGQPPGPFEVAVGQGLARRLHLQVGGTVEVQGADHPTVAHLRVAGLFGAADALNDEGVLAPELARALAGLPAGESALVRFRPETEAAQAAVERQEPALVVTGIQEGRGTAGDLVLANVTVANLGAQAGQRELTLRVDGVAAAHLVAVVPGHAIRTFPMAYLVPAGRYALAVNPGASGEGAPAAVRVEAPASALAGAPLQVRVTRDGVGAPGVEVALFADAATAQARAQPLSTATTDGDGVAGLPGARAGLLYVGTWSGERAFAAVSVADSPAALLQVEAVWTVPPAPVPGQPAQVFAQVRNAGGAPGTATIHFFAGDHPISVQDATLDPGAAAVLDAPLVAAEPVDAVRVENTTLHIGSVPAQDASTASPSPAVLPLDATQARTGEQVGAALADRVLGDARAALGGVAATALLGTLAVVFLATGRSLRARRHVVGILEALGQDEAQVRRRATVEAGAMGAATLLAVLPIAKLAFLAAHAWGQPAPFAHAVPDPVGWLFAAQAAAAFGGACALAAFLAAGPVLRQSPLRPAARSQQPTLPPKALAALLEPDA